MFSLVVAAALTAPTPVQGTPSDDLKELCGWRFDKGQSGWAPSRTARVTVEAGCLRIVTDGADPILVGPPMRVVPRDGDLLEVTMTSSRAGEVQWFWRTHTDGPYSGFAPEVQRLMSIEASTKPRTYRTSVLWEGAAPIVGLRFDLPEGRPGTYRLHGIRVLRPGRPMPQPHRWRREYRVPVAPPRIDISRMAPPETQPVGSDYTVAMWYFAAWEPEYTWDGWKQVAERSPWRIPLLYDSTDPEMEHNGIRFYRASRPRVLDWHVHWLREHAVNLMLWDWYPQVGSDGSFDPTFFGNRALELGFIGKSSLGGPPAAGNRFAGKIQFATMWTNHAPMNKVAPGLVEYVIDQFFSQPNYHRIDGKPLLPIWSVQDLVSACGGEQATRDYLDRVRATVRQRGYPGVYIAAVNGLDRRDRADRLGLDGVMAYNYLGLGGYTSEQRRIPGRIVEDHIEDFATQTLPGQRATWERMAREFGRDYLLATTPMQNFEPTLRPWNPVIRDGTADLYREMLEQARTTVEKRGLRRFVSIEAFNEWLEGSYVEPSTQWGYSYLQAIRDAMRAKAGP